MKKEYISPEIELVIFDEESIMTASGAFGNTYQGMETDDDYWTRHA